ncbi:50S ribosomal protein L25 [Fonticella tunisiensis]|uniref:Large ribosomal subunit protein bL25 n=1 Tax=Fonticella tunisiensis TaxID=1096341 RepID=A0A4V3ESB1_9CLOT|nr:50S ribosomal protein L25 [Fonticella tunisiensis]TDT52030.1 LSU ribosomal protein L25P [Fonticella tunisiensis]
MSDAVIRAIERTEKPNRARKDGFVPGVIYGKGISSKSVKFEAEKLKRLLRGCNKNGKIGVKIEEEIKQCVIKEIQKDPLTGNILHIELQIVNENDIVKLKVPVAFNGQDRLQERKELLQIFIPEVEVTGRAADIPGVISVNVENKKSGDKIYIKDISLGSKIKIENDPDEIIAVVTEAKELDEAV